MLSDPLCSQSKLFAIHALPRRLLDLDRLRLAGSRPRSGAIVVSRVLSRVKRGADGTKQPISG
jgi:hypothetical protein